MRPFGVHLTQRRIRLAFIRLRARLCQFNVRVVRFGVRLDQVPAYRGAGSPGSEASRGAAAGGAGLAPQRGIGRCISDAGWAAGRRGFAGTGGDRCAGATCGPSPGLFFLPGGVDSARGRRKLSTFGRRYITRSYRIRGGESSSIGMILSLPSVGYAPLCECQPTIL